MKPLKLVLIALMLLLLAPMARAQTTFGNAINLNGTNQNVVITNFGNIIPTNEITVEFWANTSAAAGQSAFILDPDLGGNRLNAHLNYGSPPAQGVIYWDFGTIIGGGRLGPSDAPVNSISNWVHYAFVASRSGNFMSIYTNGVLLATKTGMTSFVRGAYNLDIGGGSNYFGYSGSLDDFRVWNTALSKAQIQANLGVPLTGSETNLVVYYRFDNSGGTVATNSAIATGALYNGVIAGGAPLVASGVSASPLLNSVVTTTADTGAGSLRTTVSNALPGTTITFTNNLSGQTITLTNGQIELSINLTIDASGLSRGITINGNAASRIFKVPSGPAVILNSLTISNGYNAGSAGGILNNGDLTVNRSTFASNSAAIYGGGIESFGPLTLNQCTFFGNSCGGPGGRAIDIETQIISVNQCTISDNPGPGGWGIYNEGTLNLTNSICSGNPDADENIYDAGTLNAGSNLVDVVDVMLAQPDNYGGPTPTMPPLPDSPAIDGCVTGTSFATDQRGFPRIAGPFADIGAVEAGDAIPSINYTVVSTADDFLNGLTNSGVSLRSAMAFSPGGSLITFAPVLSGQTITLTGGEIAFGNLMIDGSALANGVQISGNNISRIFNITNGAAALTALTLAHANGGGADGGALLNAGTTTLNQCTFTANSTGSGGAILNASGVLTLNECTLAGNSISLAGGGGGIVNEASLFLNGCTLTANSGGTMGNGIYNDVAGHVSMNNTVVAGNGPNDILNDGTLALTGPNIVQSINNNTIGITSGTAPINANPNLAALGNYGGPTPTAPPLPGSPAIDAGNDLQAVSIRDQRGFPRLFGAHVDIGAVEAVYSPAGPGKIDSLARLTDGSVRFSFTNLTDATFSVLATTNASLPASDWIQIGSVTESPAGSGLFFFTDAQATNYPQRFYRVKTP